MLIFSRNKHIGVYHLGENLLEARTDSRDNFQDLCVRLTMQMPELRIVSAKGSFSRSINTQCSWATAHLDNVKGLSIGRGITSTVDKLVGGPGGCTKLANAALEAVQLTVLARRRLGREAVEWKGFSVAERVRAVITANPGMRNSCAVYADDSPFLQGWQPKQSNVQTPQTKIQPALSGSLSGNPEPATSQRLSRTGLQQIRDGWETSSEACSGESQVLYIMRNKLALVEKKSLEGDEVLLVKAILEDFAHGMVVELTFSLPDLVIVRAEGSMPRTPYDYCRDATLPQLNNLVGLRVAPGLTLEVDNIITRKGCYHYGNLALEACHAALEGTLGLFTKSEQSLLVEAQKNWLIAFPQVIGTCLAYQEAPQQ